MGYVVLALVAGLAGLVAGFLVGKRATRWCPVCGLTLSISHCPAHGYLAIGSEVRQSETVQR